MGSQRIQRKQRTTWRQLQTQREGARERERTRRTEGTGTTETEPGQWMWSTCSRTKTCQQHQGQGQHRQHSEANEWQEGRRPDDAKHQTKPPTRAPRRKINRTGERPSRSTAPTQRPKPKNSPLPGHTCESEDPRCRSVGKMIGHTCGAEDPRWGVSENE